MGPHEYEEMYVNRKNYHSKNVQVEFDAQYKLQDMVAGWPGSTQDARILREGGLWKILKRKTEHSLRCYILRDSGYASKR